MSREPAGCGTPAAYARHRYYGEEICDKCRAAWNAQCTADRPRSAKPWRRLPPEPAPVVLTPREAAVLAAHRAGDLVLGGWER